MKKLEELGIDPAPWEYEGEGEDATSFDVICHLENGLRYQIAAPYIHFSGSTEANARLIAAAPNMYKTEYDLVDVIERLLNGLASTCDTPSQDEVVAKIEAAKEALAKAAGEEVAND